MKILIPKDKALKKLNDRLNDTIKLTFNDVAGWRSRTIADIHDIFSPLDGRYSEIGNLFFPTNNVGAFFSDAKSAAIALLNGYKNYIIENIPDPPTLEEQNLKQENFNVTLENAKIKQSLFNCTQNYDQLTHIYKSALSKNEITKNRIIELEQNILQLENFSLKKLFQIIHNLSWGQLTIIVGILTGIFIAGIFIGHVLYSLHVF